MKKSKTYYHKQLKIYFSLYIRRRAGECEAKGKLDGHYAECGGHLQCSHIKTTKAYPNLKYDPFNALALCYRHHIHWWHKETKEAIKWFETNYPERDKYLEHNQNKLFKPTTDDLKELLNFYKEKTNEN